MCVVWCVCVCVCGVCACVWCVRVCVVILVMCKSCDGHVTCAPAVGPPLPQQFPGWVPPQPQAPHPNFEEPEVTPEQEHTDRGNEPPEVQQDSSDTARPKQKEAAQPANGKPLSFEEWMTALGGTGPIPNPQAMPQGAFPASHLLPPVPPHFMPLGKAS